MAHISLHDVWLRAERLLILPGKATGKPVIDPLSHLDQYM